MEVTESKVKEIFKGVYIERGCSPDQVVSSWSIVQRKYTLDQILEALDYISDNITTKPNSAHFKEALSGRQKDNKDTAQIAMKQLKTALSKFGYTNPNKAKEFLGGDLWASIGGARGYADICRNFDTSNTSYIAQLRDNISANLENPREFLDSLPENKKVNELLNETARKLEERK